VEACEQNPSEMASHDQYIHKIIEQMIRREARGTSIQKQPRRLIENLLLGDARKRGETHQWMYDRFNLSHLLIETGYRDITIEKYNTSRITDWNKYGLDVNSVGEEYKTSSMYVEAVK
jgi:hypothetical protein